MSEAVDYVKTMLPEPIKTGPVRIDWKFIPSNCMYIFSDGVYEIPRTDGSMWPFKEFSEFVQQPGSSRQSDIERIFQHARKLNQFDSFEDDFTIIEVVFN